MAVRLLPLLLLLAALLLPAAGAQAATPRSFFGVMADGPLLGPQGDLAREAALMGTTGVGSVRLAVYWREMQPAPGGPIDWSATDRVVGVTARNGVGVLPVLLRAPGWATGGDVREGAVPDAAAYGAFVAEAVRRYGPRGSFWAENPGVRRAPLRRWQVWNEPDITRYLEPPPGVPWPAAYVPLLRAAHTAIRREDPGATIVMAGVTNRSWERLAALYRAGARGLFDAAAIHAFTGGVSGVVRLARLARGTMRRYGDARKPLLLTEITWSSARGFSTIGNAWETDEAGQARRVREVYTALARERTRLRIAGAWWYTWLSPAAGTSSDSFDYSGLRRLREGRPVAKPALTAFRRVVRELRAR